MKSGLSMMFATPLSTLCIEYDQNLYHRALLRRVFYILIELNSCLHFFLTGTVAAHIPSSLSICLALPVCMFHSMLFVILALKLYYGTTCPSYLLFNVKMFGLLRLPGATPPKDLNLLSGFCMGVASPCHSSSLLPAAFRCFF